MKKKVLLTFAAVVAVAIGVVGMSAFEAHIINVTAHIENALAVNTTPISFGTVFPQEYFTNKTFTVGLSDSFLSASRADDVNYVIKQKPKCKATDPQNPIQFVPLNYATHLCPEGYAQMLSLCEYLSKGPDQSPANDTGERSYFQGDHCLDVPTPQDGAIGRLAKSENDLLDTWTVDLKVPPFAGYVAQDWPAGCPVLQGDPEGIDLGCDLWVEVTGISETEEPVAPLVGANLSLYQAPVTCDVTVDDDGGDPALDTIPEGITAATPGQTVCVAPGTYTDQVVIEKSLVLASTGGPGLTFIDDGIIINADNVTVKGFLVSSGNTEGTTAGFYIKPGVDDLVIRDNHIDGPLANDPNGSLGIVNVINGAYSNILIENNEIHEWTTGIYVNPFVGGTQFTIRKNDIDDNLAGIGGVTGALVDLNEFENLAVAAEAIGADSSYDGSIIVNNNFLDGTKLNDYNPGGAAIVAENNFWNTGGVNQTTPGEVDYTPETAVQYAHN